MKDQEDKLAYIRELLVSQNIAPEDYSTSLIIPFTLALSKASQSAIAACVFLVCSRLRVTSRAAKQKSRPGYCQVGFVTLIRLISNQVWEDLQLLLYF
jgi:hypothetical protein